MIKLTKEDRKKLLKREYGRSRKKGEGPAIIYRALGVRIAIFLRNTPISANQVSVLSMIFGYLLIAISALLYAWVGQVWHLMLVQILLGLGMAFNMPALNSIFTRWIDKGHEGFEWALFSSLTSLGAAATAAIGGFMAATIGFRNLFIVVAALSVFATLVSLLFYKYISIPEEEEPKKK